jgi:hypothetical protein
MASRRRLAECEKQFRDAKPDKRMNAQSCRTLCRMRVLEEIRRRKGKQGAEHLKLVLDVIEHVRHLATLGFALDIGVTAIPLRI